MLATEMTVVHCEWFPTDAGRRKTRGLPTIPKTQSVPEIRLVEMEVPVLYGNDSNPVGGSFFTGTVHLFLKISWQFCTERLGSILCFSRFFSFYALRLTPTDHIAGANMEVYTTDLNHDFSLLGSAQNSDSALKSALLAICSIMTAMCFNIIM